MILVNDEGRYDPLEIHVINTIGDRDVVTQILGELLLKRRLFMPSRDLQDVTAMLYAAAIMKYTEGSGWRVKHVKVATGLSEQARIIPKKTYMKVEIIYAQNEVPLLLGGNRYASIDLGLNNLVTMVTDFSEPIIYSGKTIKALNRHFNKSIAKYRSLLETNNGKKSSKRIERIYTSRNNRMDDLMHKVSRHIVNTLEQNNVGTLVCGRNKRWKDSIDLGQRTNQQFVQIPHERLISMLRYKCEMAGIRFIENEESYTSKCDALALEPVCKHETYKGKRVCRGLFQSSTGRTLNSDVNGALNILRKVVGDSCVSRIADSGRLFRPRKLNNLYCLSSGIVFNTFNGN